MPGTTRTSLYKYPPPPHLPSPHPKQSEYSEESTGEAAVGEEKTKLTPENRAERFPYDFYAACGASCSADMTLILSAWKRQRTLEL